MNRTELHELYGLAEGLTRETLHGAPPIATTMRLADGVMRLARAHEVAKRAASKLATMYNRGECARRNELDELLTAFDAWLPTQRADGEREAR